LSCKRFLPFGGVDNQWIAAGGDATFVAKHLTAEGVTPSPDNITSTIMTFVPQQYSCLYTYTDKTANLFEDDIPAEEVKQAGTRISLVREMHNYGKLKAATNAFYSGGTSTETVSAAVSGSLLRKIKRDLQRYHCDPVTSILDSTPSFGKKNVDAGWVVFCHTDCESDLYDLPGFIKVAEYGNRSTVDPREIGSWESFRFVTAPHLTYYPAGGVAVGATGLKADDSTNIDVYPMIVMGEEAFAQVALRGLSAIDANHIPHSTRDKTDPGGQRGYVWASTWHVAEITNQDWMAVVEVGVTAL
jgi:N4-gp56 family major capsid protein